MYLRRWQSRTAKQRDTVLPTCVVAVNEDFQVMDSTGSTDAPVIDTWQRGSRDCRCADVHHDVDNDKTKTAEKCGKYDE